MTDFDPERFGKKMADIVRQHVKTEVQPLLARIAELENAALKYRGVHQRAQAYKRGDAVTHSGGLWIAITPAAVGEVPGKSDCWQLAHKSGASNGR